MVIDNVPADIMKVDTVKGVEKVPKIGEADQVLVVCRVHPESRAI